MIIRRKIILVILLISVFLGGGFIHWGILFFCVPKPRPVVLAPEVLTVIKEKKYLENQRIESSYHFERNGIRAAYLSGSPALRGAAFYAFNFKEEQLLEAASHEVGNSLINNKVTRYCSERWQWLKNNKWLHYFSDDVLEELAGYAMVRSDNKLMQYKNYNQLIAWQTVYDRLKNNDNGFGLSGMVFGLTEEWTDNKHVFLAGNIDFQEAAKIESLKTVALVNPEKGFSYLNVFCPGQIGVVSAMNEKGIGITLLSAVSDEKRRVGYPATLLAREVMLYSGTIKEAVALIKDKEITSAETFIVGSGDENRFVAIEKDAKRMIVRPMRFGLITAGNYFRSQIFQKDEVQLKSNRFGQSKEKNARLKELIYLNRNKLSVKKVASILRDKQTLFGKKLSYGHPHAINSLNTVHSVIFDLKQRLVWVGGSPFNLGVFTPFALNDFTKKYDKLEISPDRMLANGKYKSYMVYKLGLKEAKRLYVKGFYQESLAWIQEMHPLNPRDYALYLLAGKALAKLNRKDEALYNLFKAKRYQPGSDSEKQEIEALISNLKKTP